MPTDRELSPGRMPTYFTRFIGREAEVAALRRLVEGDPTGARSLPVLPPLAWSP